MTGTVPAKKLSKAFVKDDMKVELAKLVFYQALKTYAQKGQIPLHMPGHKGGRGFLSPELAAVGAIDFTELPGLDDWHRPDGVLLTLQRQLAACFGTHASYFLHNGATSGIHALFMALGEGASVAMPRQAHRSFFGGMVLAGTRPVYIKPRFDEEWGLPLVSAPQDVAEALNNQPVKAFFGLSPSYYGTCGQEKEIIDLVHAKGLPVFYDEAHGAHFGFHPAYPPGTIKLGADAVVHGLHKTLPALTGAACLHLAANGDWQRRTAIALDLLTTTSPSQPLLASAEWAINWISSPAGIQGLEQMYQCSLRFNQQLESIKGLARIQVTADNCCNDPGRVSIGIKGLTITGYELERILAAEFGIQVEMSGYNYVVAIYTPFNTGEEWQALAQALAVIAARYQGAPPVKRRSLPPPAPLQMIPREAFMAGHRRVRLQEAAGEVSAEIVAAYPPGIPCLLPGEVITPEMVDYLQEMLYSGGRLQGMLDPAGQYIYVIDK